MPRLLVFLCWMLGVLLVADIILLLVESAQFSDPEPGMKEIMMAASLISGGITILFIGVLVAFFKRAKWSFVWLKTITIVTAVLLIGGTFFDDQAFQYTSALDAAVLVMICLEAITCLALFVVLMREDTRRWFEGRTI